MGSNNACFNNLIPHSLTYRKYRKFALPQKPLASNQRHSPALQSQTSGILVSSKALKLGDPCRRTKSHFCITQNITTTDNTLYYRALHHILCIAINGHTSCIQLLAPVNSIHLFDFQFPGKKFQKGIPSKCCYTAFILRVLYLLI